MNNENGFENKTVKNTIIILVIVFFGTMVYFALTQKNSNLIKNTKPTADNNVETADTSGADTTADSNKKIIDEAMAVKTDNVRPIDETDHYKGDISAPVQLIVYDDFECPFCANYAKTIEQIIDEFGDKVVVAIRHYTLRTHPNAVPAAVASECAADQGKFWEMHDKLFENNRNDNMGMDQYKQNAKEIGLDPAEFDKCLDTFRHKDKIAKQLQEGRDAGVSGTPGAFVNGEPIAGAYPFDDFVGSDNRPKEGMKSIIERHLNELES